MARAYLSVCELRLEWVFLIWDAFSRWLTVLKLDCSWKQQHPMDRNKWMLAMLRHRASCYISTTSLAIISKLGAQSMLAGWARFSLSLSLSNLFGPLLEPGVWKVIITKKDRNLFRLDALSRRRSRSQVLELEHGRPYRRKSSLQSLKGVQSQITPSRLILEPFLIISSRKPLNVHGLSHSKMSFKVFLNAMYFRSLLGKLFLSVSLKSTCTIELSALEIE